jgi:hypothetical protein
VLGAKFDGPRRELYFAVYTVFTHTVYVVIQTTIGLLTLPIVRQTIPEDPLHFFPAYEFFPQDPLVVLVNTDLFLRFFTESLVHCKQNTRVFATRAVGVYVYGCGHVGDVKLESDWVVFTDRVVRGVEIYGHGNHIIYHPSGHIQFFSANTDIPSAKITGKLVSNMIVNCKNSWDELVPEIRVSVCMQQHCESSIPKILHFYL